MSDLLCECRVDFSTIHAERILPFIFSLNEEKSVLYPCPEEYQTFCYDVFGTGRDTSEYADLSHFVLGICNQISQNDIAKIEVSIDGIPQTVTWGKNVEIKTPLEPDKTTGGVGLKFDFGLNKVSGDMQIIISFKKEQQIGPINIWVKGGTAVATGLEICGPVCEKKEYSCEYVFHQLETVSVPVRVNPYAAVGATKAICSGAPIIRVGEQRITSQCPKCAENCSFSISQNIMVDIPISFGADIEIDEAVIQCGNITAPTGSCNCTP